MTDSIIREKIEHALDDAENTYGKVRNLFESKNKDKEFSKSIELNTNIPDIPILKLGEPQVGDYIALVLDIRNSTEHLLQAISPKKAKVSLLERTFYETTAVITGGILAVSNWDGGTTELLGDGLLAIFKAEKKESVHSAHNAAKKCISINKDIVNVILKERYNLPPIEIGIGMAYSKALVTILGTENNYHPKAIGECVYRASKISKGRNQIYIDEKLKLFWPKSDKGKLRFNILERLSSDVKFNAYTVNK